MSCPGKKLVNITSNASFRNTTFELRHIRCWTAVDRVNSELADWLMWKNGYVMPDPDFSESINRYIKYTVKTDNTFLLH